MKIALNREECKIHLYAEGYQRIDLYASPEEIDLLQKLYKEGNDEEANKILREKADERLKFEIELSKHTARCFHPNNEEND